MTTAITKPIPPYFHPTTVALVDDNYAFSQSLKLTIPEQFHLLNYLTPELALDALNDLHPRPSLADLCFSREGSRIHLNLNVLEQEIKHIDRFQRISVLLVDYAMPTMNGLEFCAQLKSRDMRRVLLTGVADEKTAVQAFNDGLIDHYLPKATLSSAGGIVPYIREQQLRFFQNYHARLTHSLGISAPPFTRDPIFIEFFNRLLRRHAIVEYYLVTAPIGYLCVTRHGETFQVLIQDQQQKLEHLEVLEQHQAPAELRQAVVAEQSMLCFYEHPDDYLGHEPFPWDEITFSATSVQGHEAWQCSVVENPPMDIDFDPANACHQRFLTDLNQS